MMIIANVRIALGGWYILILINNNIIVVVDVSIFPQHKTNSFWFIVFVIFLSGAAAPVEANTQNIEISRILRFASAKPLALADFAYYIWLREIPLRY